MQLTRTTILRIIKLSGALMLTGIIIAYAIWRSLDYARGPEIKIFWPTNGETATSSIITITGQVLRVNKLTLNGNPITTDEQGNWNQDIFIFQGLNKLTLSAQDQFGRNTQASLDIYGIIPTPATYKN
ncbi:MAG: hypothetical protein WC666_04645 [Candidatus Paceibacterota bacterium]|jgi:hypothetical protein